MRSVARWHYPAVLLLTFVIPIVLAHLYNVIPLQTWLAAAIVNSVLSLLLLIVYRDKVAAWFFTRHSYLFYLPALAVFIFCVLAILVSSFYSDPLRGTVSVPQYLWLLWIPIVEEIVFRLGIGSWLRGWAGNFWGGYCAALCFALAHTLPTWQRLTAGEIGVPVGVLLLGVICEFLFVRSKSLMPCIVFHAACNASVPLFTYFDQRWFAWLSLLFQTKVTSS